MSAATPLDRLLADIVRTEGPIGVDRFMRLALGHPVHGYYVTRDPLGAAGDFITAPEISQMFGELLGLWCAACWQAMGAPGAVLLVELGPGRGTLMADMLRAGARLPGFRDALSVHLVETSPALRAAQAERLGAAAAQARWHAGLDTLPEGPALVVANEFFDALPVRQFVRDGQGWCERLIGLGPEGGLAFGLAAAPAAGLPLAAPPGAVLEVGAEAAALAGRIGRRIASAGGAALFIDYGDAGPRLGDTLQAVRRHRFAPVLEAVGEADLTTHVDFAALGRAAAAAGAQAFGPLPQGMLLRRLGIETRAARLAAAHPETAAAVRAACERLTGEGSPGAPGMGRLFKALALVPPGAAPPPGFDPDPVFRPLERP